MQYSRLGAIVDDYLRNNRNLVDDDLKNMTARLKFERDLGSHLSSHFNDAVTAVDVDIKTALNLRRTSAPPYLYKFAKLRREEIKKILPPSSV